MLILSALQCHQWKRLLNQRSQKDNADEAGKSESQEGKVKSKTKYHDFLKKLE